jgi:hypothetical protein
VISDTIIETLKRKFERVSPELDERGRRRWAASEALELGYGGIKAVAQASGLNERTIRRGCAEFRQGKETAGPGGRSIRQPGGGRQSLESQDQALVQALDALVEPTTRGDPMSPLRWTCKSTRKLAQALNAQGHGISHTKVAQLLRGLDYRLQRTQKTLEGTSHPHRDAQFRYINRCVKVFQKAGQPVISVDAKKKELVGPYGVYDVTYNTGWVNVGIDHDTAEFAVESIRRWWQRMGRALYPHAQSLLITADSGGSNANRNRLWKRELQQLADQTGLQIYVRHFPPGTSKWNKIEHRLFCHITENWRGRPLLSHEVIVHLIANTTTDTGLSVQAQLDENTYPTGIKVSDEQMKELNICPAKFHGNDWNYSVKPRP